MAAVARIPLTVGRGTFPEQPRHVPERPWHVPDGRGMFSEPDSNHTGTISITICAPRVRQNVMQPRIQCVLTQ